MESKRPREEAQEEKDLGFEDYTKRHKPYNHIISLLDSEEEESTQDLSPFITTLQQEISCSSKNPLQENDHNTLTPSIIQKSSTSTCYSNNQQVLKEEEEEEEEKERVMRHLLQASDDELGIPNTEGNFGYDGFNGDDDGFSSLSNKFWELEDETANYYALMQSELFLWGY